MLKKNVQRVWQSKILLVLAVMLMMGVITSTAAAAESETVLSTTLSETLAGDDFSDVIIMHYNRWGAPTGKLHNISIDLYNAIIDALLASGYPISPQNIDCMAHRMHGEDCFLNPNFP